MGEILPGNPKTISLLPIANDESTRVYLNARVFKSKTLTDRSPTYTYQNSIKTFVAKFAWAFESDFNLIIDFSN